MPAARVEKAGKAFLLPLIEPLREAVELTGSGLLIWDEICDSSHGIAIDELVGRIATLYSTDVSEVDASVQEFVLSLRAQGLIVAADKRVVDE
ncbi:MULTISPECIES: PqqD family protein [unclassified Rathayibacter]|uniref:PqqD family protein n=1 Tax=unclassified Rathayibacter TaxID=2609250 RepID=UPI0006FBBED8|nr:MULTISPECIES: PqqD family protein [unclassified Rathayibacter]KQP97451.1 hypothetical protein ASF42_17305 [Rathayibacter sp. Leaf294]KQS07123.1 hypothetical protein ASG06_18040 [Rathayibacter sp. Leaf185]